MKNATLKEIEILITRYPALQVLKESLQKAIGVVCQAYSNGNKLIICGNGGSAADSLHIVGELMKGFALNRKISQDIQNRIEEMYPDTADYYINNLQSALPAISLVSETSLLTAYSNDKASDLAFAQQILGHGKDGDVLLAISTSGNSANVLHACKVAKILGLQIISLTGEDGGKLASLSNILLNVPSEVTYQIQELHLPIYHTICLAIEQEFFGEE